MNNQIKGKNLFEKVKNDNNLEYENLNNEIDEIKKKVRVIQAVKQTDVNELKKEIDVVNQNIEEQKKNIDILLTKNIDQDKKNKLNDLKRKLDNNINILHIHREYIDSVERIKRNENLELLKKKHKTHVDTIQTNLDECDKYESFYKYVETLHSNLKKKYGIDVDKPLLNGLKFKKGDQLVITAHAKDDDGNVDLDTVTVSKKNFQIYPLVYNPNANYYNNNNDGFNLDDFGNDEHDNDDASVLTINSGIKGKGNDNDNVVIESNIDKWKNSIKNIETLSENIWTILHEKIINNNVGYNVIILDDEKQKILLPLIEKIYTIIKVFELYIKYSYSNSYLRKHIVDLNQKFKEFHKEYIDIPINTINIGKILRKEYEFFIKIKEYCKNIFEESNDKKYNNINDIKTYTDFNNDFINKLKPHINKFYRLIAEVFTTSNNTSLRPKTAESKSNYNKRLLTSRSDGDLVNHMKTIPKRNVSNQNVAWLGGSNHKHKKYTKKRNPNKKYTISRKVKNGRLNKTRNRNIRNKNKTNFNKYI